MARRSPGIRLHVHRFAGDFSYSAAMSFGRDAPLAACRGTAFRKPKLTAPISHGLQYDGSIAAVHGPRDTIVIRRSRMAGVIVLIIFSISFRNFCFYYWRSISAEISCSVTGSDLR